MNVDEGVVKVRKMNANAKLPIRGTSRSAGYDLAIAQSIVVPAHGKCLMKIGLSMALCGKFQYLGAIHDATY